MLEVFNDKIYVFWFEKGASNITAVELKDQVVIFDSSLYPEKFEEVIEFMELRTGKKVSKVFITHFHPDHSFGAFASKKVEINISERSISFLIEIPEEKLSDISQKAEHDFTKLFSDFSKLKLNMFNENVILTSGNTVITGVRVGGHTPDSTIFKISPEEILICGDLVFNEIHAELEGSNVKKWIEILKGIKESNIVIPGHGRPGGFDLVNKQIEYLEEFLEKGKEYVLNKYKNFIYPELVL